MRCLLICLITLFASSPITKVENLLKLLHFNIWHASFIEDISISKLSNEFEHREKNQEYLCFAYDTFENKW